MGRHLLIYDVEWWILGKHAKVIQQYHPSLDLMSIGELDRYLERHSSEDMNQAYDRIGAMCLGIATIVFSKHIRIDASARSRIIISVRIMIPFANGSVTN